MERLNSSRNFFILVKCYFSLLYFTRLTGDIYFACVYIFLTDQPQAKPRRQQKERKFTITVHYSFTGVNLQ